MSVFSWQTDLFDVLFAIRCWYWVGKQTKFTASPEPVDVGIELTNRLGWCPLCQKISGLIWQTDLVGVLSPSRCRYWVDKRLVWRSVCQHISVMSWQTDLVDYLSAIRCRCWVDKQTLWISCLPANVSIELTNRLNWEYLCLQMSVLSWQADLVDDLSVSRFRYWVDQQIWLMASLPADVGTELTLTNNFKSQKQHAEHVNT